MTRPRASALQFETLADDYSNIRGLNYVPVYPGLWRNPPPLPPTQRFVGTASPVAQWRFYDSRPVERQLRAMRGLGCNALRVFLSFEVWQHWALRGRRGANNPFIRSWDEFLRLCDRHGLYVMAVLWNAFSPNGLDPTREPLDGIDYWRRSPARADTNLEWVEANEANEYVIDVVQASEEHPSMLFWDVMNEPDPWKFEPFLKHFCDLVRKYEQHPERKVTIGFAATTDYSNRVNPLLAHPTMEVVSYHPYGLFRQNVVEWTRVARIHASPQFALVHKPVLASEGGSPGLAQTYANTIRFFRDEGVGFFLWSALIDHPDSRLPFQEGSGILFEDGELRHLEDGLAFQDLAREQGVAESSLASLVEKVDQTNTTPLRPFDPGYGVDQLLADLSPPVWNSRPFLSDANVATDGYLLQREKLSAASVFGTFLLVSRDYPRLLLAPEDEQVLIEFHGLFVRHELFHGSEPWLVGDPPVAVDWLRYYEFHSQFGDALFRIAERYGLGS